MKAIYLPIILCLLTQISTAQSDVPVVFNTFIDLSADEIQKTVAVSADSAALILATLNDIRYWKEKNSFSGDANFGFFGTTTRNGKDNLYNIYGGINMDWVLYPGNLDFSTLFGVNISDGKLTQNVSRIDASYDHQHLNVGNGMVLENYIYVNRSTDAYLGIDQRYEIGGGIIINNWIKKLIEPANERFAISMHTAEERDQWESWLKQIDSGVDEDQLKAFNEVYKEGRIKNRMANSKLRTALLAGMYFELEQTTVLDSIQLPVTSNFRWVLRPTFDVKLKDGWKFKLRPYFKMPVPWDWKSRVVAPDGQSSKLTDYYINMTTSISTKLLSKRVEVSFIYNVVYDNAPARTYYEHGDGSYELLINNDLHQSFRVSLNIALDQDQ